MGFNLFNLQTVVRTPHGNQGRDMRAQGSEAFSIWEMHLGFVTAHFYPGQRFRARSALDVSGAKNESRQCLGYLGRVSPDPLPAGVSHTCWCLKPPFFLGKGAECVIFHSALGEFRGSQDSDQSCLLQTQWWGAALQAGSFRTGTG